MVKIRVSLDDKEWVDWSEIKNKFHEEYETWGYKNYGEFFAGEYLGKFS